MSDSGLKIMSLEEIEATLEFLNGNGPQTMKVNVDALARTAREYHRLRKALLAASERSSYYWERQGAHTSHDFKNEGAIALATELLKEIYE